MAKIEVTEGTPELKLTKDITKELALKFRKKMAKALSDGAEELDILINSPGGVVMAGLSIIDTIGEAQGNGIKVTTRVIGEAASMAAVIAQVGDERVMGKNSYLMFHEVSGGTFGEINRMEERIAHSRRLNKHLLKLATAKSKISVAEFQKKLHKFDWYVDSAEAKRLGLVDKVI